MSGRTKGTSSNIAAWLKRQGVDACTGAEFQLVTRGVGDADLVTRWPGELREHPDELAEDVLAAAQSHCDLLQTDVAYNLVLVTLDDPPRVLATQPLRRKAAETGGVEEGSIQGVVQQMMRHNEAMVRMMLRSQEATINQSLRLTDLMSKRLTTLEEERTELLETEADAVRTAQVDEVAERRAKVQDRRSEKMEGFVEWFMKKALAEDASKAKG